MRCGKVSVFYLLPCLAFCYRRKFISDENCRVNHPGRRDWLIKSGTRKARKPELEVNHGEFEWVHAAWLALAIVLEIVATSF